MDCRRMIAGVVGSLLACNGPGAGDDAATDAATTGDEGDSSGSTSSIPDGSSSDGQDVSDGGSSGSSSSEGGTADSSSGCLLGELGCACEGGTCVGGAVCVDDVCVEPLCGDGVEQDGEACDDGNAFDEDWCLTTCEEASCGDGVLNVLGSSEDCDGPEVAGVCTKACGSSLQWELVVHEGTTACGALDVTDDGGIVVADSRYEDTIATARVSRYDLAGELQWTTEGFGLIESEIFAIAVDPSGGVVFGGVAQNPFSRGLVGRVDAVGDLLWVDAFDEPGFPRITDLDLDAAGAVYAVHLTGIFTDGLAAVRKYSSAGALEYSFQIPISTSNVIASPQIAVEPGGGFYVTSNDPNDDGSLQRRDADGGLVWELPTLLHVTGLDRRDDGMLVLAAPADPLSTTWSDVLVLDADGNQVWSDVIGDTNVDDVRFSPDGGIVVSGSAGSFGDRLFLRRYDAAFDETWSQAHDGFYQPRACGSQLVTNERIAMLAAGTIVVPVEHTWLGLF
jgi:cysteine-rich repeat protein